MPPSAIHMDHVRSQHRHHQMAALERHGMEASGAARETPETGASRPAAAEGDTGGGMSFWDVLDVINPLQHIPVVNKIYQAVTGDTIGTPAKIAGAALFFGPVGVALASADAVVEKTTGKDTLGQVADLLGLDTDKPAAAPAGEDDPFTVTAPRPRRTADAEGVPAAPVAGAPATQPVLELTDGQAALLESLMAQQGAAVTAASGATPSTGSAPAGALSASATSASATSPAAGGIATAGQLKKLESTPGADAALAAARGVGLTGVVASLPTPGAPASGSNLLTAMSQEQQSAQPARTGRSLADYRANAVHSGSMVPKPMLTSRSEQMVRNMGGGMPGAAFTPAAAAAPKPPAASQDGGTATRQAAAWPPEGPAALPKELIADMMAQAMNKYESQARRRADAAAAGTGGTTVH
ncbi:hypothetical protein [Niveispirillum fermenti]|uniref:hypothetical protein n=1 Tax=Niveispirillum fermenti TaxID=1233113 RepID=UPI003A8522C4